MKKSIIIVSLLVVNFVANAFGAEPKSYSWNEEELGKISQAEVTKTKSPNGMFLYTICIHTDRYVVPAVIMDGDLVIAWDDACIKDEANGFWWDGYRFAPVLVTSEGDGFWYRNSERPDDPYAKHLTPNWYLVRGDKYPRYLNGPYTVEVADGKITVLRNGVVIATIN